MKVFTVAAPVESNTVQEAKQWDYPSVKVQLGTFHGVLLYLLSHCMFEHLVQKETTSQMMYSPLRTLSLFLCVQRLETFHSFTAIRKCPHPPRLEAAVQVHSVLGRILFGKMEFVHFQREPILAVKSFYLPLCTPIQLGISQCVKDL